MLAFTDEIPVHLVRVLAFILWGFLITQTGVFLGIIVIKTYSLASRISQLCSNGLDGSLIQMNPVVLGGIIPMFLALASRNVSMFLPHEFEALVLGASDFRVLCLFAVAVFDGHISFRVILIFLLGTNFGNL